MFIPSLEEEVSKALSGRSDPKLKTEPPTNAEALAAILVWSAFVGLLFWKFAL